jgi:hypothetical protein
MILQVTDSGELVLPAELVQAPPCTTLEAERHGEAVTLKPVSATAGREKSAALFLAYAKGKAAGQGKDAASDFGALPPDAREIALIAAEIYMDPTPGDPFEERLGEFLRKLRDLRFKYKKS